MARQIFVLKLESSFPFSPVSTLPCSPDGRVGSIGRTVDVDCDGLLKNRKTSSQEVLRE